MAAAQLSVVIPVYGNWWLTARCLRELDGLRAAGAVDFETIVVDNGSADETPEGIAAYPWVRYLRLEENHNFAGGCNAGARVASAPLVLFLNNDAYPRGDALTPLVRAFDREEVSIAGGALFFEDGTTQAAGLVLLRNAHWHYSDRNLPATLERVVRSRDVLAVSGAAMAVRTRWFLKNGGFDESYINGFEDVDLCMRAREQQCVIRYVAEARFAHYEGASAGRYDREAENELRFYRRWAPHLANVPRTARGGVGAIAVHTRSDLPPLVAAALEDLEEALRSFGHPVLRRDVQFWQRLDRRFRRSAALSWFADAASSPSIVVRRAGDTIATIQTVGAAGVCVPWLPCAAPERAQRLSLQLSLDGDCKLVALAGGTEEDAAALHGDPAFELVRITPAMLLGTGPRLDVACVVHAGLTDDAAFGNVLLAQAGLPAATLLRGELRAIFASDVVLEVSHENAASAVARLLFDPALRERYGTLVASDARRRFSPRRSAIRIVDLLCAARFGLERPGPASSNAPLRL